MKLITSLTNATFYFKANIVYTQLCSNSAVANQRAILIKTLIISISNKNGLIREPLYLFKILIHSNNALTTLHRFFWEFRCNIYFL